MSFVMAFLLRQAGSLKPEIRLAQAVSEFEAALSPDQKSAFQASRARAVSTAPTLADVMRLTAEIDLKATSKHGRGRCFGPRMTNTLQAIQQFAALGDIIVGGGQNLIACGVWAAARMTLHVIAAYFAYLESLSLLFMAIGRNAPRYQNMTSLYPKSETLQRYLCEYFIIVTKLCHQSVTWTKKPALSRFSSTISDPQMKSVKDDLDLWSSAIKEETNLLLNQTVVEEAKRNSLFRSTATSQSDKIAHQLKIEEQNRVLDACSQYDYRTTWKQMRKCGSTKILTICRQYQQWKLKPETTSILFLGKLGAGKSVLLANIVDDLNLVDRSIPIYFFARYDSEESMRASTILGCLLRQLLERLKNDTTLSEILPDTEFQLDVDDVVDAFRRARPKNMMVFIVVDGLDECEMGVQRTVLEYLRQIQTSGYRVCLSVRSSEQGPIWNSQEFDFAVFLPENNPDIAEFVEAEVNKRVRDGRLVTGDPNLVQDIKQELITRSCGMFLWTSLQLDSICSEVSDHDIRQAIQDLPQDLTETFRRNLVKATLNDHKKHHIRLFKLLVSAKELLTSEQLRQAASVTVGQAAWSSDKEINSIYPVLRFCGSLVMVDEEEETVRFIHHSARRFCIEESPRIGNSIFSEREADQYMAEILVTYLSWNIFETRVSSNVVLTIDAKEIPKRVALNVMSPYRVGKNIAERLLPKSRSNRDRRDIGPTLAKVAMDQAQQDKPFPLLPYAREYWLRHTAHLEDLSTLPEWHDLLEHPSFGIAHDHLDIPPVGERAIRAEKERRLKAVVDLGFTSTFTENRTLYWALANGHILILKHELTRPRGCQKIKTYVTLWQLLRHVARFSQGLILYELDFHLIRWLSPMFVNLAMDHPAKWHCLKRIPLSDDSYLGLVRRAMQQFDVVAIWALIRKDYLQQKRTSILEWRSSDGIIHQDAVPLVLEAALSIPPRKTRLKWLIENDALWLFELISWLHLMGPSDSRWSENGDGPFSFSTFCRSLRTAGVSDHEIELMKHF